MLVYEQSFGTLVMENDVISLQKVSSRTDRLLDFFFVEKTRLGFFHRLIVFSPHRVLSSRPMSPNEYFSIDGSDLGWCFSPKQLLKRGQVTLTKAFYLWADSFSSFTFGQR